MVRQRKARARGPEGAVHGRLDLFCPPGVKRAHRGKDPLPGDFLFQVLDILQDLQIY